MSIVIDSNKCVGCMKCLQVCPGSLIKFNSHNKAYIKYPKDCWGCTSCLKECRQEAIAFYLGADIGGYGSKMYAKVKDDVVCWKVEGSNSEVIDITVNRKASNQY